MTGRTLCCDCCEPLAADEKSPQCASCAEYWEEIEVVIRHAQIERSVVERLRVDNRPDVG